VDSRINRVVQIRIGIITLVLYSLTIMTYLMNFYEPFEPDPIYGQANELLMSIERDNLIFFLILAFLLCFLASMFISLISYEIVLYTTPVIEANAKLKSKKSVMEMHGNHKGFSHIGFNYSLTFEIENGIEMNFRVIPKYYTTIIEGNKGILKYKQGIYKRFIGFDIKEIE
jgi:hypothetical protein